MIELIPALDIMDGKCVRLTQGNYDTRKVYRDDPLDAAREYEDYGIRRLHVVDLDGARAGRIINHRTLERIASHTALTIDFGGGLQSEADIAVAFECGARMISGGSIAVRQPDVFAAWLKRYGSDRIILGADARGGMIAVGGWEETTALELIPFIASWHEKGITKVISTDISVDGMLSGISPAMYKEIQKAVPGLYIIASGGVGNIADIERLAEASIGGVIIGKALYEGRIALKDLVRFTERTD
ncbi:MAG: 1-(5-phosphoribosyl)-5-[(5-phosphoribosylamino)methylideneamino]imidazole-4-carboxamide isomerase [Tannerellaceae bacterium]|jgi:phosphoribosylformimino-5-aminoimidazole carboxamide ribotide isomerase|nr:1-(5-phosphoribosyl)-5-[(5-phosphoribosylamino)methylideneamino]imidazole-4-carboxamide isomerase [Tannerellaceae bacterium]